MESTDDEIQRSHGDDGTAATTSVTLFDASHLFSGPRQAEWDIMYHALALKGRGSPIHVAGPPMEQPIQYRKEGYAIGDVMLFDILGYVDFHFNACVPADSPFNGHPDDIPEGFSPLFPPFDPTNVREDAPFKGHTVLDGRSVRKYQIPGRVPGKVFDAVAEEMAILTVPGGMISRDVIDVSCFRKYIAANAIGWYKFVNKAGNRFATNGDLRLVVGWDRCSSWSLVLNSSVTVHIPDDNIPKSGTFARFNVGTTSGGKGVLHSMVDNRRVEDPEGVIYQNQSIFLRTLNISVCDDLWSELAEDLRPHLEQFMPPRPTGTPFKWESRSLDMHPANGINTLLLKQKPHAKFAITQDSDWISVLKPDDPCLPTAVEFLSRILEVYNVCEEDDVVFLEYKPEALYRTYLKHDHHTTLTLPLWKPTIVGVGAVGYLSKEEEQFITLFNALAPGDSTSLGIPSLSPILTNLNVVQTINNQRGQASELDLDDTSIPTQRVSFPLKVGEKAAHIYTGPTCHSCFEREDLPMEWFQSNVEKIVEIYGVDRNITNDDLVLITGTLDAQDYAFFVSDCHREGSVTFEVDGNPQTGQPWGIFTSGNNGQFTSKVSHYGGPSETVLVSCLRVASCGVVPWR